MPYVHCLTNVETAAPAGEAFKTGAAAALAEVAGKPENYLFVSLHGGQTLYVRGKNTPGAVLRVDLVGTLGMAQKKELSARLCRVCHDALGVGEDSVYIIFGEIAGENWGWNGGTFS